MTRSINRRALLALASGAAAFPPAARAQPPTRRIAYMAVGSGGDAQVNARRAFLEGMEKLGWAVGGNFTIEYRYAISTVDQARAAAAEIVRLAPDLIVTQGSIVSEAVQRATGTIPIVFVAVSDPLSSGLVKSMARPGGNLTGFTNFEFTIGGKWLETLSEAAPAVKRVLFVGVRDNIGNAGLYRSAEAAASARKLQAVAALVRDAPEAVRALDAFAREPDGGLVLLPSGVFTSSRDLIVALAAKHRLPAIYPYRTYIDAGGLMSYDTDGLDLYRRAAIYVDRILRGERPGDLPVQGPTKYELVINLKVAKALGLTIPLPLLARADEVIE